MFLDERFAQRNKLLKEANTPFKTISSLNLYSACFKQSDWLIQEKLNH